MNFDSTTFTIIGIVVFATLVIYIVERYTSQKAIQTMDALKLSGISAVLTTGVLYTVSSGGTESIIAPAVAAAASAQEMFVGKPAF